MKIIDKECAELNDILNDARELNYVSKESEKLGFKLIENLGDPSVQGFVGIAFEKVGAKEIVIAIRGTATRWCLGREGFSGLAKCPGAISTDFKDDFRIYKEQLPKQLHMAEGLLASVRAKYLDHNLTLTGFSLGGADTQILGIKHALRTVSFDSPGIKSLIEQYAGSEALARNKGLIQIYNSAPNLINTFGEYYTDVTQIKFTIPFKGNGYLAYALYSWDQHDIKLMAAHFDNQVWHPKWIQNQFAGYALYVLTAEQEGTVGPHKDKLWEKKSAKLVSEGKDKSELEAAKEKFEEEYKAAIFNKSLKEPEFEESAFKSTQDLARLMGDGLDLEEYLNAKITEEDARFLEMLGESEEGIDLESLDNEGEAITSEKDDFDLPESATSLLSALEGLAVNGPDDGASSKVATEMSKVQDHMSHLVEKGLAMSGEDWKKKQRDLERKRWVGYQNSNRSFYENSVRHCVRVTTNTLNITKTIWIAI